MKNRVILVTGGNRGIGLATVKELAQNPNDTILLGCRNLESGKKEADKIGSNVKPILLDLSSEDVLKQHIAALLTDYPKIDVLVNNAAVLNEGDILDIQNEKFKEAYQVNTLAPYQLIKAIVPKMIENKYGRVINVSSGWGSIEEGLTGPFSYSFTKAGLNALTIQLAQRVPRFIKVNSICPGWVRTRMGGMMATRSPKEGAGTIVWLVNQNEDGPTGGFYRDQKLIEW